MLRRPFVDSLLRLTFADRANRAHVNAGAAIDAGVSINYELAVSLGNCFCRASTRASTTTRAIVTDYVSHFVLLSINVRFAPHGGPILFG